MAAGGSPHPSPRALWEGWWAGLGIDEPQPLLTELMVPEVSLCVSPLFSLQSNAAFELAKLFG